MCKRLRELKRLVADEVPDEFDITLTRNNHYRVVLRSGNNRSTLFFSSTPSDFRAVRNFRSQVRNAHRRILAIVDANGAPA